MDELRLREGWSQVWTVARSGVKVAALLFLVAIDVRVEAGSVADVDTKRLLNADGEPGAWFTGGRDYQQSYYSPLSGINKNNVRDLGFAWTYDIDAIAKLEATPVVVDGTMFTTGSRGEVYALDARTGRERWKFKPEVNPDVMRTLCCGPVNRGVAVWRGKVYVASLDGYLYALRAGTGAVAWKVDTIQDRSRSYSITGAPYIAKDRVVIGNSGAEFDARGYITAYDTESGKLAWRFFTVPGDPKKGFEHPELASAAKTWDPNSRWDVGLGGTAWDGMAYDPVLNLLYVGTGNGVPQQQRLRSPSGGDNLFLSCILAINPDTGRLVWHYQTTPGESWDYTATQKLILADLAIDGQVRRVLMQAPKNGFFYVLDRKTGELLSAKPYVNVTWATHVDLKTGRPQQTEQGDYSKEPKLVFPSTHGGHNWQPMAYNRDTGLVYIPAIELPEIFGMPSTPFVYRERRVNRGMLVLLPVAGPWGLDAEVAKHWPSIDVLSKGQPDYRPRTFLRAWNPIQQRLSWEIETTDASGYDGTGVATTAGGLVLQGRNLDELEGRLAMVDAERGVELHSIAVPGSIHAAPAVYSVAGEQYIAVLARGRDRGHVVAFKLGGSPSLEHHEANRDVAEGQPPVPRVGTAEQIALGEELFARTCVVCHADPSRAPDLTKMSRQTHDDFSGIVLKGTRAGRGMGSFADVLSETDAKAIHAYLIDAAWQVHNRKPGNTLSNNKTR